MRQWRGGEGIRVDPDPTVGHWRWSWRGGEVVTEPRSCGLRSGGGRGRRWRDGRRWPNPGVGKEAEGSPSAGEEAKAEGSPGTGKEAKSMIAISCPSRGRMLGILKFR